MALISTSAMRQLLRNDDLNRDRLVHNLGRRSFTGLVSHPSQGGRPHLQRPGFAESDYNRMFRILPSQHVYPQVDTPDQVPTSFRHQDDMTDIDRHVWLVLARSRPVRSHTSAHEQWTMPDANHRLAIETERRCIREHLPRSLAIATLREHPPRHH
jgi:hypothetical protein